MKNLLKKWWPTVAHLGGIGVLFLDPAVQGYAASHKGSAALLSVAWGIALHWAQSPKSTPASQF